MIWAGIIGDQLVGPFRVPEGVKMNSEVYCLLLEQSFFPWFDKQTPAKQRSVIFQQDNAPSHASKYTLNRLKTKGLKEGQVMTWPPNSADLNPMQNLLSILNRVVYRQFKFKDDLWEALQEAAAAIQASTVSKLTSSMDSRLIEVVQKKGWHVNK